MTITNINHRFFIEKKHEARKKELHSALKTYRKFHADHLKRVEKAKKEQAKEEAHILGKIKEIEDELKLRGEYDEEVNLCSGDEGSGR